MTTSSRRRPLIVAAFEPFAGRAINRAAQAVNRLAQQDNLVIERLPVDFVDLPVRVAALVAREPRALLLVGEARRPVVTIEQLALNVLDDVRPDNRGRVAHGQTINSAGPLARRAPWDAPAVAAELAAAGISARASFHAGTYACNLALYLALELCPEGTAVGFVHVPAHRWPRGPRTATLSRAIALALAALIRSPS